MSNKKLSLAAVEVLACLWHRGSDDDPGAKVFEIAADIFERPMFGYQADLRATPTDRNRVVRAAKNELLAHFKRELGDPEGIEHVGEKGAASGKKIGYALSRPAYLWAKEFFAAFPKAAEPVKEK